MKFLHVTALHPITGATFKGKDPKKIFECLSEISDTTARKYLKETKGKAANFAVKPVVVEPVVVDIVESSVEGEVAVEPVVVEPVVVEPVVVEPVVVEPVVVEELVYEKVTISEEVSDIPKAQYNNLHNTYKLWKENYPCNILYTEEDIIFFKDVSFVDRFTKFSMFNMRNLYEGDHNLRCEVRYFPSTMDEKTWQLGLEMSKQWPKETQEAWNYESVIYNTMLWSQTNTGLNDVYSPNLYSFRLNDINENNKENTSKLEDSQMCSIHSSGIEHIPTKLTKLSELGLLDTELVTKFSTVYSEFE